MYAFAVLRSIIFFVSKVAGNFFVFFEITIPKYPLPVCKGKRMFLRQTIFFKKFLSFSNDIDGFFRISRAFFVSLSKQIPAQKGESVTQKNRVTLSPLHFYYLIRTGNSTTKISLQLYRLIRGSPTCGRSLPAHPPLRQFPAGLR